jgi:hypothetical protein
MASPEAADDAGEHRRRARDPAKLCASAFLVGEKKESGEEIQMVGFGGFGLLFCIGCAVLR